MASNAAARLARLTRNLGAFDRVVVRAAGEAVYDALIQQLEHDTGGDRALSGIAGGKYKMDVDITPLSNPAGVRLRPKPKHTGMWTIVSKGTSAHQVAAKRRKHTSGTKRGSSRGRSMRIGEGGWATGPWRVGGSRGKDTWPKGVEKGLDKAGDIARELFHRVVSG